MVQVPRVSVIIPAYNAERYIRDTLGSVLAQTYPNIEVIVVDDGSRDGTADVVRSFGARVRYVKQENSGGCGRPRNHGMRVATGDMFVFIDSDDLMLPERIAREVDVLRLHPGVGMVFSNYRDFEGDHVYDHGHFEGCPILSGRLATLPPGAMHTVLLPSESTELLLTENFGSSSPMVRREAVERVGQFDETLRASEDYEFQYRVASHYCIALIPQVGWHKRLHQGSMSSQTPNILHHKILTRTRLLEIERVPRRRRKLKRRLALLHRELAYHATGRNNRLALKHALTSLRFRPQPNAKLFARLLLDALGLNPNGARS
jgi:glycosyltransferase involved in cell wall biosynthesis